MKTLRPYQARDVARYSQSNFLPLFYQMRLGKSLVAIRWAKEKSPTKILVVCPLTPMGGWMDELADEGECVLIWKGGKWTGDDDLFGISWHLITYQALARNPDLASEWWDVVILDESTAIRNPKSVVGKLALRRLSKCANRAILTGLPDPESLFDVWNQMAFVMGGSWMGFSNFWKWRDRWAKNFGYNWELSNQASASIRQKLLDDATYLTREAAGLGEVKVYEIREAPLDTEATALINDFAKTWSSGVREAKQALTIAGWMHRVAGGHTPDGAELPCWKYKEVVDLLKGELANEKVVVWFTFSMEMRRMWRLLKEEKIPTTFVQGSTSLDERRKRRFQFQGLEKRVMLIQSSCGKFGYDLSAADTAIYFSNSWSHEVRAQSEDRIVNVVKKKPLLIIDLVCQKSADESVLQSLTDKISSSEETANYILSRTVYKHRTAG